ncbi:hypothetical protein [Microbulbifer sp. PSTR4-B]|uniref:hypothetical protein n=1 Tax=unclassified Microbulbifer TaxID=2619833 RepID=UPI00403AE97D
MKIYAPFSVVGELRTADRRIDIVKIYDSYSLYPKLDEEEVLEGFFQVWAASQEIKEDVLPEIDSVLSGEKKYTELGAEIFGLAYIEHQNTKFISGLGSPDLELSTVEFKDLVEQWVDFLEAHGR